MGIFSITISPNSFQNAREHISRQNQKFCDFLGCAKIRGARIALECAKIRGARIIVKWGCAKIRGAKIEGAKIKGARKFKGIR